MAEWGLAPGCLVPRAHEPTALFDSTALHLEVSALAHPQSAVINVTTLLVVPSLGWVSLVAQPVKNLPAVWETQVRSLDQEDPLEEGMAAHSSVLAWRIPWTEEPGGLQSMGLQRVRRD